MSLFKKYKKIQEIAENSVSMTQNKKEKYMKGWEVGTPMTYSEINYLIRLIQNEILKYKKIRSSGINDTKMTLVCNDTK